MKKYLLLATLSFLLSPSFGEENEFYSCFKKNAEGYYSQCQQDKFLYENFFQNKKNGVFVEIGAHNGIAHSNTKFFEDIGWAGLCIEPNPEVFEELKKNRTSICVQGCVSDKPGTASFLKVSGAPEQLSGLMDKYEPDHLKRVFREVTEPGSKGSVEVINVECFLLNDLLEKNKMYRVDFLSIDTEGGEFEIVKSIDFDRFDIEFIDVENNFNTQEIRSFLASKGYELVTNTGWDDIFRKKSS